MHRLFLLLVASAVVLSPIAICGEKAKPAKEKPATGKKAKKGAEKPGAGAKIKGTGAKAELTVTPKAARTISRALDYVAKQQSKDGSFGTGGRGYGGGHRAAMTGLAGLAFLSAGHVPGRGKHAKVVEKAAKFLLKLQDREGCYADAGGRSMHGHGYALHFMAEVYGMTSNAGLAKKLRKSVQKGVRLTCRTQSTTGGWYYQPVANRSHEGSITVTQVQAIWAARQAGINVPQKTIDKGVEYMKKSQVSDGGIAYSMGQRTSRPALSAAGVMVFCGLGRRETKEARRAIAHMRKLLKGGGKSRNYFPHYNDLYLGQALFQAGDPDWSKHYPKLRGEIIKCQQSDGSITRGRSSYGGVYSTACEVLVLAIPYQYLPTFQR
jgi:hypothetical protein